MSTTLTYPSFLKLRNGGFLQTNDVLIEPALRQRLTVADRRRFDRIAGSIGPTGLSKLAARRTAGRMAAGPPERDRSRVSHAQALANSAPR